MSFIKFEESILLIFVKKKNYISIFIFEAQILDMLREISKAKSKADYFHEIT